MVQWYSTCPMIVRSRVRILPGAWFIVFFLPFHSSSTFHHNKLKSNLNQVPQRVISGIFFFIFVVSIVIQLVDKILPMLGFEPQISGVGSDRSINWATTSALLAVVITSMADDVWVHFQELNGMVEQRMRWACGANPDLQVCYHSFSFVQS